MATDVQIALQPQAGVDPAAAQLAAAVRQVRASLALLSQQVGQTFVGTVVEAPELPDGFSQISTTLAHTILRLERPIPPGSRVQISVQPGPSPAALPLVTVTPLASERLAALTPQAVQPVQVPAPATFSAPAPLIDMPPAPSSRPVAPIPSPEPAAQSPSLTNTSILSTTSPVSTPIAETLPTAAPRPIPASAPQASQPPAQALVPPVISATRPAASLPPAAFTPPSSGTNTPIISTPSLPDESRAPTPHAVRPSPMPASAPQASQPPAQALVPPVISSTPPATSPPPAAQVPPSTVANIPIASMPSPFTASMTKPLPAVVTHPMPALAPQTSQGPAQAFVPPMISTAVPAASPPPAALVQIQQSAGPLLKTLVRQFSQLPPAVAQAASQLLAQRLPLDRTPPTAAALKTAVLQSGVLLDPPARGATAPDTRTALIQLRSALLNWAGSAVDPIAPVGPRPPPPTRGAPPRAPLPPNPASPEGDGAPRETARHLLSQTEGALARIKLLQLTSQGNDQRLGAATAPAEWNLELPLLVGRELAMAQIQIGRDARDQKSGPEPSWRLRFALRLSAIGEVGAHVALTGRRTSVALWAEDPETASVLEEMLPELSQALRARGLEAGALSIRRGAPQAVASAPVHLMDART